jgi:hypothetical protein
MAVSTSEDEMSVGNMAVSMLLPGVCPTSVIVTDKTAFEQTFPLLRPELIMVIRLTHACNKRY